MDVSQLEGDPRQTIKLAMRALQSRIQTSLPGEIKSFNASALTAVVQLGTKGTATDDAGAFLYSAMPLLVDIPVIFPRGGGCTLTFPVADGDECLVVFASRAIDAWWQSGGAQAPMEQRMHNMADGFAILGPFSQAQVISGVSTTTTQLRSNDGEAYVELDPVGHIVNVVAPGGMKFTTPTLEITGNVQVDQNLTVEQNATITGMLKFLGGMVGSAVSGAAAVITGTINFIGQLTANGKRIDDTHTHNGVQPGSGNSGNVN